MPPTKDRYHHGDLREELLRASLQLIESEGLAAVSLRKVAREAGVSPGAPYHHFADRAALMSALAARGFEILGAAMTSARETAPDPRAALIAMATGYVAFARDHSAYFRIMFRPELSQPDKHPDTEAAGDAAFAVLEATVADAVASGFLPAADAETMALAWWSLAHGMASLTVDGKFALRATQSGTTPQALATRITRIFADLIDGRGATD
ncbi:TetR/AcrR family transcriptional regulator [Nocardia seriolae]|uniref:TetR family transcriptional regulator n=1 Tax=Nocardia seriolae TaxID=37332 RepID=A0ABC9YM54_9NOCA|nr:TetR/AcrR family transcriptional regulator [Nocardia seriolae]BEK92942.1 TetR-like C-terminal domain-containing protein [Nocardia seriolae]GAM44310.1 TetR family transcriptional regulator [Nocardia seriolae]GAP26330.1 TetR family transcriptional regulator [Nocardia seriolae]